MSRLVPLGLVMAALLVALFVGYSVGKRAERAVWLERERAHQAAVQQATEQARQREQEAFRAREIVESNYREELARQARAAASARSELDRLRSTLAARDRAERSDPAAAGRTDGAATERDVLAACGAQLVGMASDADAIATRLSGLQHYVREVCQKR